MESNRSTTRYELLNLRHHRPRVRRPPTTIHRPGRFGFMDRMVLYSPCPV